MHLSSSRRQRELLRADVPDAFVVVSPMRVKREETASLEVLVGEPSTDGTDLAWRPPAPSSRVDIHASERRRHAHVHQAIYDVPFALPLFENESAYLLHRHR